VGGGCDVFKSPSRARSPQAEPPPSLSAPRRLARGAARCPPPGGGSIAGQRHARERKERAGEGEALSTTTRRRQAPSFLPRANASAPPQKRPAKPHRAEERPFSSRVGAAAGAGEKEDAPNLRAEKGWLICSPPLFDREPPPPLSLSLSRTRARTRSPLLFDCVCVCVRERASLLAGRDWLCVRVSCLCARRGCWGEVGVGAFGSFEPRPPPLAGRAVGKPTRAGAVVGRGGSDGRQQRR
jgi:hypothetical protein